MAKKFKIPKYIKVRKFDRRLIEIEYFNKLSKEEQEWIKLFYMDYLDSNYSQDNNRSLFYSDEVINKKYKEIKSDKKLYKELKEELKKENTRRKNLWARRKEKLYKEFIENNDPKDFIQPTIPSRYKHLSLKDFLVVREKRKWRNKVSVRRRCVLNRDAKNESFNYNIQQTKTSSEFSNDIIDQLHYESNEKLKEPFDRDVIKQNYIKHLKAKTLDVFILNSILEALDLMIFKHNVREFSIEFKKQLNDANSMYNKKEIKKRDYLFFLKTTFEMIKLKIEELNDSELNYYSNFLNNIFEKDIFIQSKRRLHLTKVYN